MSRILSIICDYCGIELRINVDHPFTLYHSGLTLDEVTAQCAIGWDVSSGRAYCPKCVAELRAKGGNNVSNTQSNV